MRSIHFPPYRLDLGQQRLWRGPEEIVLRAKTFAVLQYLAERPGQLVTKGELLESLWPDLYVCDVAPTVCVSEIRKALGGPSGSEVIATVHRRGYRFVAPVVKPAGAAPAAASGSEREEELSRLAACLDRAARGKRQAVLVSGAMGLGKTALLEAFRRRVERSRGALVAMGRCLDLRSGTAACAPFLEALGRLAPEPQQELLALAGRYAPDRSPRGLAEAVEAFALRTPLVLMLEDLQWSDPATLDLISILAQGQEPARLLLVGTFRPEAVDRAASPLSSLLRELRLHGLCREERLCPLDLTGVSAFLRARLGGEPPGRLANDLLHRTGGIPLFLAELADGLAEPRRTDTGLPIPANLRRILAGEVEHLPAFERRILEAASVAGEEFTAAEVAAGRGETLVEIDETCAELARQGRFLTLEGEAEEPDGTLSGRYAFFPPLFRDVLYDRVPPASRSLIQSRIAGCRKAAPRERAAAAAGRTAPVLRIPPRKEDR